MGHHFLWGKRLSFPDPAPTLLLLGLLPFLCCPRCTGLPYPEYVRFLLNLPVFADALPPSLKSFPHLEHQTNIYSSFQTQLSITFSIKSFLTSLVPAGCVAFLLGDFCALHGLLAYPT